MRGKFVEFSYGTQRVYLRQECTYKGMNEISTFVHIPQASAEADKVRDCIHFTVDRLPLSEDMHPPSLERVVLVQRCSLGGKLVTSIALISEGEIIKVANYFSPEIENANPSECADLNYVNSVISGHIVNGYVPYSQQTSQPGNTMNVYFSKYNYDQLMYYRREVSYRFILQSQRVEKLILGRDVGLVRLQYNPLLHVFVLFMHWKKTIDRRGRSDEVVTSAVRFPISTSTLAQSFQRIIRQKKNII